jgi:hypothetical protein
MLCLEKGVVHWDEIRQMIGNNNAGQLGVIAEGHVGVHEYVDGCLGVTVRMIISKMFMVGR